VKADMKPFLRLNFQATKLVKLPQFNMLAYPFILVEGTNEIYLLDIVS
jgi:hypothetical protein